MSVRVLARAAGPTRAAALLAPLRTHSTSLHARSLRLTSTALFSSHAVRVAAPRGLPATLGYVASCVSVRRQGTLQSLLEDPNDPYLPAITDVDLVRVARVAQEGPRHAGPLPRAVVRGQQLRQSPPPLASRAAQSEGEAVLQSLYEAGLERLKAAEEAAAKEDAEARAAFEKLSDEEKKAQSRGQWASHLFDGLCATNAVLRMQIEDAGVTKEELDAAYTVYELIQREVKPFASTEVWQDKFVEELKELAIMFAHVKDPRPITH